MFSRYYQTELAYLRDMGRLFGQANPTLAAHLTERGMDPDVERLLEGFAFLSARIRERVDDAVPEIVHSLCDLLLPHYLRTIPATTVVEFTTPIGALRGRHVIERGTMLGSQPVQGTSCSFRTTQAVDLLPLAIEQARLDDVQTSVPILKLSLRASDKGLPAVFEERGMRFYLAADLAQASMICLWLGRYLVQARIRGRSESGAVVDVALPAGSVRLLGFEENEALLPWSPFSPSGFRLLQEYFTLPQKFLFFDVVGLEAAKAVADPAFELWLSFDRPPTLPSPIQKQTFRLHCAPAINLFERSANPMVRSKIGHEQLIKAADLEPAHMEVYSVDKVSGLAAGNKSRVYRPFIDFAHHGDDIYYQLRRAASPIDNAIDTYISILSPRDVPPDTGDEMLLIDATFSNRALPSDLRAGQVSQPTVGSPQIATFTNIGEVTKPMRPPLGLELQWRLLSHLSLNHLSLQDVTALRSLLALYNFQALVSETYGRQNRMRSEAVSRITATPARRILEGASIRGTRSEVEVQEEGFASEGDVFLFGCVLDRLFADHVSINAFHQLTIKSSPSQGVYEWQPKAGHKTLA